MGRYSIPDDARAYILAHPDHRPAEQAAALGVPPEIVYQWRSRLREEGVAIPRVPPTPPTPRRRAPPLDDIMDAIEDGRPLFAMAARAGVSIDTLFGALRYYNTSARELRRGLVLSGRAAVTALGYVYSGKVLGRLRRAGLKMRRNAPPGARRANGYLIRFDDLAEFAATDAGRRLIDLARVADPDLAEAIADRRRPDYRPPTPIDGNEVRRLRGAAD